MTVQAAFGLAAQALLVAWIFWTLAARAPSHFHRIIAAGAAVAAFIPIADGVSAAMASRALWGDPSVTTLQLLVLALAGRPANVGRGPAAALALFGLVFYPLALGLGDFDPYRLGYAAWPVAAALGAAALLAWRRGQPLWLWLLAVDLAAFAAGLPESDNLWDALFDPLLVAAALIAAVRGPRR
ncbi:hypothetical protein [Sulfurisoma sediminicola]|uniref:Uncharacterized protein n=1 Tax=Sulfurisoma sediminicola TaxID=1381557 RepID=A0A497XE43_9PROT|nr:hypothetical protein [Sulfurisoma sediminicola]RLJ65282.1 hypothetical protein DFR35_1940 [Sulfurisoma sediminicola]